MQKNTEHIPNRDDVSAAILQHLDGLRGIDPHCHHLPDDQFQNMGVKFYTITAIATEVVETVPEITEPTPEEKPKSTNMLPAILTLIVLACGGEKIVSRLKRHCKMHF